MSGVTNSTCLGGEDKRDRVGSDDAGVSHTIPKARMGELPALQPHMEELGPGLCVQLPLCSQNHKATQPGFGTDVLLWVLDNERCSCLQGPGCQALLYTWGVDICSATQEVMLCPAVG